jgi:hypothetical protein
MRAENSPGGRGFKIILEFPIPDPSAIEPPNGNPVALV